MLSLLFSSANAAELASPTNSDPHGVQTVSVDKSAPALHKGAADCNKAYAENNCAGLRASLPEADRGNVIDCSVPESYVPARIALGVGQGVGAFVWDTAKSVVELPYQLAAGAKAAPGAIANSFREQAKCFDDQEYKKSLLEPLKAFKGQKPPVEQWTCNQIRQYVEQTALRKDIEIGKKKSVTREYEQFIRDNPDKAADAERRWPKRDRDLTDEEKEFDQSAERRKRARGILPDVLKKLQQTHACYTNQYKAKLATQIVAGIVVPAGAAKLILDPKARALLADYSRHGRFTEASTPAALGRNLVPELSGVLDKQASLQLKKITDGYGLPVRVVDDLPDGKAVRLALKDGEADAIEIGRRTALDNPGRLKDELGKIDRNLHATETFPAYNSIARDRGLMVDSQGRLTVPPGTSLAPEGTAARMIQDAEARGVQFQMMDKNDLARTKAAGLHDSGTGVIKINPATLTDETSLRHVIDHELVHRDNRLNDIRKLSRTGQIQTDKGDLGVEGYRRSMAVDEFEANRVSQSHLSQGVSPAHQEMARQAGAIANGSLRAQQEVLPSALQALRTHNVQFSPTGNGRAMYMIFEHNGKEYYYFVNRRYISDTASRAIFDKAIRDRLTYIGSAR